LGHSSTSFTNADFDKIFEEVKNPLGVASLKDIRERMGLSKEEFYSRFSQYIEANYQMYRGGDEGIVKNGVIFGIIKR
jgi:DNA-binding transcriptional regulator YiaG